MSIHHHGAIIGFLKTGPGVDEFPVTTTSKTKVMEISYGRVHVSVLHNACDQAPSVNKRRHRQRPQTASTNRQRKAENGPSSVDETFTVLRPRSAPSARSKFVASQAIASRRDPDARSAWNAKGSSRGVDFGGNEMVKIKPKLNKVASLRDPKMSPRGAMVAEPEFSSDTLVIGDTAYHWDPNDTGALDATWNRDFIRTARHGLFPPSPTMSRSSRRHITSGSQSPSPTANSGLLQQRQVSHWLPFFGLLHPVCSTVSLPSSLLPSRRFI